jgi:pimeloyl-ACP methyl ester carboxylesterase
MEGLSRIRSAGLGLLLGLAGGVAAAGGSEPHQIGTGMTHAVQFAASKTKGELVYGVSYRLWLPPGVKTIRGIIVHQHGCGEGACKGGETAADDWHWQALARKWDCALLGPSYQQPEGANCALWCDPRHGSGRTFERALVALAEKSSHPELTRVPWALWGHSGGAQWAGTMLLLHPERVVAVWLRSGAPALVASPSTELPGLETPDAALAVPVVCNPGIKEKTHERFQRAWNSGLSFFQENRARGGLVAFAPDPRTTHECGDSRYLAIPFFDACLAQRLPRIAGAAGPLPAMDSTAAWLAPLQGKDAMPAADFAGQPLAANWLPNAAVARAWRDYVTTGTVADSTPPAAPTDVRISVAGEITWAASVDFESGVGGFIIERDGHEVGRMPEKPATQFGRPLLQKMSYHDTPTPPLAQLRWIERTASAVPPAVYRVISVNSAGLRSAPSSPATRP